jgi:hypothetical protein
MADIKVANRHGHTCLMIACYKGHFKIAKYLIDIGADVNRKSVKGNTALHDCAESGSLEIMKLLIGSGARYIMAQRPLFKLVHWLLSTSIFLFDFFLYEYKSFP